ncbi:unnamed protein product, partial [Effrenium voratum]
AAVIPEGANSTFRRRRLVGREVMAAAKAMACLERIMQDVDPAARQLFTYQEARLQTKSIYWAPATRGW